MTEEEEPTANTTLAIGGVSSPLDSFVVAESSVLRTNFNAENPAHSQSAKRYDSFYGDRANNKMTNNKYGFYDNKQKRNC